MSVHQSLRRHFASVANVDYKFLCLKEKITALPTMCFVIINFVNRVATEIARRKASLLIYQELKWAKLSYDFLLRPVGR